MWDSHLLVGVLYLKKEKRFGVVSFGGLRFMFVRCVGVLGISLGFWCCRVRGMRCSFCLIRWFGWWFREALVVLGSIFKKKKKDSGLIHSFGGLRFVRSLF